MGLVEFGYCTSHSQIHFHGLMLHYKLIVAWPVLIIYFTVEEAENLDSGCQFENVVATRSSTSDWC